MSGEQRIRDTVGQKTSDFLTDRQKRAQNAIMIAFETEIREKHRDLDHTVEWKYTERGAVVECSCGDEYKASA